MSEMKKLNRVVGVIGGMGPEATVLLMSRLIEKTPAKDDSDHVPLLVDNNTQVPSRISAILEKTGKNPGPVLVSMAQKLENSGAEALVMPCNTAHHFAHEIKRSITVPFLNMIELSATRIAQLKLANSKVAVLASPAAQEIRVFDDTFATHGLEVMYSEHQAEMLFSIRNIKQRGENPDSRRILVTCGEELIEKGADLLMIACSELSLISDAISGNHPTVDTLDILVESIIDFSINTDEIDA